MGNITDDQHRNTSRTEKNQQEVMCCCVKGLVDFFKRIMNTHYPGSGSKMLEGTQTLDAKGINVLHGSFEIFQGQFQTLIDIRLDPFVNPAFVRMQYHVTVLVNDIEITVLADACIGKNAEEFIRPQFVFADQHGTKPAVQAQDRHSKGYYRFF